MCGIDFLDFGSVSVKFFEKTRIRFGMDVIFFDDSVFKNQIQTKFWFSAHPHRAPKTPHDCCCSEFV